MEEQGADLVGLVGSAAVELEDQVAEVLGAGEHFADLLETGDLLGGLLELVVEFGGFG